MVILVILTLLIVLVLITNLIFSLKVGKRFDIEDNRINAIEEKIEYQKQKTDEVLKTANDLLNKFR